MVVYDAYVAALLISQVQARTNQDGVSSLFNLRDRDSYISRILTEATARESKNIFKSPDMPIPLRVFSFTSYAAQIINSATWKEVFDTIKSRLPIFTLKFPLSHKHKFASFPSDSD